MHLAQLHFRPHFQPCCQCQSPSPVRRTHWLAAAVGLQASSWVCDAPTGAVSAALHRSRQKQQRPQMCRWQTWTVSSERGASLRLAGCQRHCWQCAVRVPPCLAHRQRDADSLHPAAASRHSWQLVPQPPWRADVVMSRRSEHPSSWPSASILLPSRIELPLAG